MKIIDLLNKIANNEELPEKIMFFGHKFIYDKTTKTYRSVIDNKPIGEMFILEYCLGFKVKIILENKTPKKVKTIEEKKIPEKIDVISWDKCIHDVTHKEKELAIQINKTQKLLNQLIDYLKSKGDE